MSKQRITIHLTNGEEYVFFAHHVRCGEYYNTPSKLLDVYDITSYEYETTRTTGMWWWKREYTVREEESTDVKLASFNVKLVERIEYEPLPQNQTP